MNDPSRWLRLYVLPIWLAGCVVVFLLLEMWGVAAIAGIITASTVLSRRDEYRRGGKRSSWGEDFRNFWTDPGRLSIALLSVMAVVVVGVLTFGFSVGVLAAVVGWFIILGLWLRALLRRRSRAG
jgi:hypothetical protein